MPSHNKIPLDGKTLLETYLKRVELNGSECAFLVKSKSRFRPLSWKVFHQKMLHLHFALKEWGIKKGDKIAILSHSRLEWILADLSIQSVHGVTVPIYPSSSPDDIRYILLHSRAKCLFVENDTMLEKVLTLLDEFKGRVVIMVGKTKVKDIANLDEVLKCQLNPTCETDFRKSVLAITPNDEASIVYTSGTTGKPKGALLTHSNFSHELRSIVAKAKITTEDSTLSILPFAHVLGRVESMTPIVSGITLAFAENLNTISENLLEIKPTFMIGVPRIFEKIYAKIKSQIEKEPTIKKELFEWALRVGEKMCSYEEKNEWVPPWFFVQHELANRLVLLRIRSQLGGKLRWAVSGGAPLTENVQRFFHACGIKVLEGYGLTETTAAIALNTPEQFRIGSVGKLLDGVELKIAEDGEIQVRGGTVFKEYYQDPDSTKEVLKEGWFSTGDIGEIDEGGFLKITDRKKELIVTSGGKKVAPQKIESMLCSRPYISHALVHGDKQKYLTALLTLNEGAIKRWAQSKPVQYASFGELAESDEVKHLINAEIQDVNRNLASYESIKKIKILPVDFSVETGELTPSLKLKRKICIKKYQSELNALY